VWFSDTVDFDAVADELYGGPREEFIRRRNALAAEAADTKLAARIKALRKPTLAAWLVNRLARERPDDLAELTRLGEQLRAAHEELAGERLRTLSVGRRETVDALTLATREIGRNAGLGVSDAVADQVHDTLQAALAGGDAAELVVAGRLATALDPSDAQQWLTAGTMPSERPRTEPRQQPRPSRPTENTDELRRRREARERVEREAETARERRDTAAETLAEARTRAREATDEVNTLRAKLVKAQRYEKLAHNAVRAAQFELGTAEREAENAERALRRHERPPSK